MRNNQVWPLKMTIRVRFSVHESFLHAKGAVESSSREPVEQRLQRVVGVQSHAVCWAAKAVTCSILVHPDSGVEWGFGYAWTGLQILRENVSTSGLVV